MDQATYEARVAAALATLRGTDGPSGLAAYKGSTTPMPSKVPDYDMLDQGYDVLENIYDTRGQTAATLAASAAVQTLRDIREGRAVATKNAAGGMSIRYKAAPGMTTIEVPTELASEIAACRAQWGDTAWAQQLRQSRGGQPTAGAMLRDDQKTKAAALTPAQRVARQTIPELYATPKGTKR